MKRLSICLLAILLPIVVNAQFYTIYKNGGGKIIYSSADVDSIVFSQTVATVTTGEAINITEESAELQGTVIESNVSMMCGIIYDTSSNISATSGKKESTTSKGSFSITLKGLDPSTTYYYRAYAIDDDEYLLGEVKSFKTKASYYNGHDYVDLGLPSGLLWATCNIGSSSPSDNGDFYAWGELETKEHYEKSNYEYYGISGSTLKLRGIIDEQGNLTPEYDVASVLWEGGWRMPTEDEMIELYKNCTYSVKTINGISCACYTGENGNYIVFPFAGWRNYYWNTGACPTLYWSATFATLSNGAYKSKALYIYRGNVYCSDEDRCCGFVVRPVIKKIK